MNSLRLQPHPHSQGDFKNIELPLLALGTVPTFELDTGRLKERNATADKRLF